MGVGGGGAARVQVVGVAGDGQVEANLGEDEIQEETELIELFRK